MSHSESGSEASQPASHADTADYDSDVLEDKSPELGPNATLADYQSVCRASLFYNFDLLFFYRP
jgi:hypothetical protein